MKPPRVGVLIVAYGSAPSMDDEAIWEYLQHILQYYRKTDPDSEEFEDLKQRYEAIGGSPLYSITEDIVQAVQSHLDEKFSGGFQAYLGMKHSPPFIDDVVSQMVEEGVSQAVTVALAPFRSRFSTDGYYQMVQETSARADNAIEWSFVDDWNLHPFFLKLWQTRIEDSLSSNEATATVVFTNHSLPDRIRSWQDPYPQQFEATARALARNCQLRGWTVAYQSRGGGDQCWLGPDLLEVLGQHEVQDNPSVLIAPIGFLMDHLEVLYDLDIQAFLAAKEMGIALQRTQMPNSDPLFIEMLVDVILKATEKKGLALHSS